jgi:hypothetical protein
MPASKDGGAKLRYAERRAGRRSDGLFWSSARVQYGKKWKMFTGYGVAPMDAALDVTKQAEAWADGQ